MDFQKWWFVEEFKRRGQGCRPGRGRWSGYKNQSKGRKECWKQVCRRSAEIELEQKSEKRLSCCTWSICGTDSSMLWFLVLTCALYRGGHAAAGQRGEEKCVEFISESIFLLCVAIGNNKMKDD